MTNWYYVQGSERVGPVNEDSLRDLFHKDVISADSYIWRKGFANWERLKDVHELDFSKSAVIEKTLETEEPVAEEEQSSPELVFNFDWQSLRNEDECFFIKIGHDRRTVPESDLFGPYSLNELKEALEDKRINHHTLIFAAGMPGWIEIGQTPLDPTNLKINMSHIIDETPLLLVLSNDHLPLIALIQEAGVKNCTLLGAGPFLEGKVLLGSIYSGTTLKAKNIKLTIDHYNSKEQKINCTINEINDDAQKIMKNYAN